MSKERPILFSGPMVRAILEGRKTQTRRVVKPQPELKGDRWTWCPKGATYDKKLDMWFPSHVWRNGLNVCETGAAGIVEDCMYGKVGDKLWVRETWARTTDNFAFGCICYKADTMCLNYLCDQDGEGDPIGLGGVTSRSDFADEPITWKRSIHMPRWASRLTLEVTGVRVERLQDISEENAIAEGVRSTRLPLAGADGTTVWHVEDYPTPHCSTTNARDMFQSLWESINGPESWAANPWVWVVQFTKAKRGNE